jgi:hypothetical protein
VSFIIPDLGERIAWYQERLRPEDAAFGNGIADWTITAEYQNDPQSENGSGPIWGCMCSPSRLPKLLKLQPDDITAKRAHIIVRTPKTPGDIAEIERTILHELGHVLVAPMQSENREAEENAMHSLDHFFSKTKLSPEQGAILARSFQNPMARAYRAKDKAMPDVTEENKDKPDKDAPKMAEGAPRDVASITADLIKAAMAGQPTDELVKELVAAQALAGASGNGPTSVPPAPPTMGMKSEDAYARARTELAQERKEAIEAIIESNPHLDDKQRAMARKQGTVAAARELIATYPRVANQNEPARMGMQNNPKTDKVSNAPFARTMARAEQNPMLRKVLGIGSLERTGVHENPSESVAIYIDGTERLNHLRAQQRAKLEKGAA